MSQTPASANKAAAPKAPVFIGIATPDEDDEDDEDPDPDSDPDPDPDPEAGVGAIPTVTIGVGTPDVRGLSVALEAPAKATDWVEAVATGIAEVLLGFRTLRVVLC